jgi:hypothetical protein
MLYNESKHNISLPWWARPTKDPILALQVYSFSPFALFSSINFLSFVRRRRRRRKREGIVKYGS